MVILAIAFLVLCVVCALKESKVTGTFKAFGVYGRIAAYFGLFAPLGLGMFVASFFVEDLAAQRWLMLGLAAFGSLFYVFAYLKCPEFLKKKVIISMLISGFGLCVKLAFFFIAAVWTLTGPQQMVDDDGNTILVYGGEVYTPSGEHIGTVSADGNSYHPV